MSDDINHVSPDNWAIRRRIVFVALTYIALMVIYIVWRGTDTSLYQQVAVALIGAAVAIIGSYVFGAVWDDKSKRSDVKTTPATSAAPRKATPKNTGDDEVIP